VRNMNLECPTGQQIRASYSTLIFASNFNDHTSPGFSVYVPGNKRKQEADLSSTSSTLFPSSTSEVSVIVAIV
jgi:hypothetical protein